MSSNQTSGKPFTGNFELETKIRVIIQDVLSATVRKYLFSHIQNFSI